MEFAQMNAGIFIAMIAVCSLILLVIILLLIQIIRRTRPSFMSSTVMKWIGKGYFYLAIATIFNSSVIIVSHSNSSLIKLGSMADSLLAENNNSMLTNYSKAIYTVIDVSIVKIVILLINIIAVTMVVLPYFDKTASSAKYGRTALVCFFVVAVMYVGDTPTVAPATYKLLFGQYMDVSEKLWVFLIIGVISVIALAALQAIGQYDGAMGVVFKIIFIIPLIMVINCIIYYYFNYIPIDLGYVVDSHNLKIKTMFEEAR